MARRRDVPLAAKRRRHRSQRFLDDKLDSIDITRIFYRSVEIGAVTMDAVVEKALRCQPSAAGFARRHRSLTLDTTPAEGRDPNERRSRRVQSMQQRQQRGRR